MTNATLREIDEGDVASVCANVAACCLTLVLGTASVFGGGESVTYRLTGENKQIFIAPTGSSFDFYRFAVGSDGKGTAQFFSESGNIQPDAFAPEWEIRPQGKAVEIEIPLSSFYMTRNAKWKTTWLETSVSDQKGLPTGWQKRTDRPQRAAEDDLAVFTANADIRDSVDGKLTGELVVEIFSGKAGDFDVTVSSGGTTTCTLRRERNKVRVPCAYPANGRHLTHVRLVRKDGSAAMGRDIPAMVEYSPIRVRLSAPQYRDNFYPGQDTSRVSGKIVAGGRDPVTLSLEGPGFPKREATLPAGGGDFAFDTKGFEKGEAWLTVKTGEYEKRTRIRNLPDSGHRMIWIENGHMVVNGKPVFRRNIYAQGFQTGKSFDERFKVDYDTFRITGKEFGGTVTLEPGSVIKGLEEREARKDIRPCDAYFKKVDELWEQHKDKDFAAWYISDEPECRNVSPVYLRHIYEYVKELDPYHPVFTASRGGKTYIDCADWFETHPYLDCRNEPDGRRTYGVHPREMSRFIDAFEAADRPDKCIGFLPTCFAYRWSSSRSDYPTFDEYLAHTWCALIAGAKTLWPYAGHDLGDRPALYDGTRLIFNQTAAYEKLLLLGKHTRYPRKDDVDRATWELDGETLDVTVDYKTMKTVIKAPARYDAEVEPMSVVAKRVAKAEAERKGRDNQLRGRYDDIMFSTNMRSNFGGGNYKFIDGTRDMLAKYSAWITNAYIEASFLTFTPTFDRVRIWGRGTEPAYVMIRKRGEWIRLEPKSVTTEGDCRELVFDQPYTTVKMRLCIPGRHNQRNEFELYELELPYVKGAATAKKTQRKAEPVDEGRVWTLDGSNARNSPGWSMKDWFNGTNLVRALPDGGFTLRAHASHYLNVSTNAKWLVIDAARFRDTTQAGYRRWDILWAGTGVTTVTHPQAGIYTLELPPFAKPDPLVMAAHIYGVEVDLNYISLMKNPANRVICRPAKDRKDVAPGDTIRVGVALAEPCEEVAAEFLVERSTGNLNPFAVNGVTGIEMKPVDESGRRWAAVVNVKSCRNAPAGSIYVKASALGSSFTRPVFGKFAVPFREKRDE